MALVLAHIDLAKAEATAIAGEVGQVAALGALAFMLVIFAAFMLVIGISLGLGEWLLGSMSWGVVDGVLAFLAVAMAAALFATGVSGGRLARSLALAIIVGVGFGVVFGLDLPNRLYAAVGDAIALPVDPGVRPLAIAVAIWACLGAITGLIVAYRLHQLGGSIVLLVALAVGIASGAALAVAVVPEIGSGVVVIVWALAGAVLDVVAARRIKKGSRTRRRIAAFMFGSILGGALLGAILAVAVPGWIGTIVGALVITVMVGVVAAASIQGRDGALATICMLTSAILIGAFTAITFGPQVSAGIGITVAYIMWMTLMGIDVARAGIDVEALKHRFYPVQTIDTSKETLEWLQKRMPPGIGS